MTYARIQEWLDEGIYTGDLLWCSGEKDGKPHGQGTFTYASGNKYVGEFRDGLRNGQGTFTWPDGGKYVGEFRDGYPHGWGTETWPSGYKYVGEWRDGREHGTRGTTTFPPRQGK